LGCKNLLSFGSILIPWKSYPGCNRTLKTVSLNLHTIIIFVKDVDMLQEFYINTFQLSVVEEIKHEWVLLQAGNCKIGLHKMGEQLVHANKDMSSFESNTKLVFEIEENIYVMRELLLQKNVKMREVKQFDGSDYLLCDGEDPEGNVFQLQQKKAGL
jgi:catechol-2,3-dioxygenase